MFLSLIFFFSSRRRHTRSLCDWSSDVCSSDLQARRSAGRSYQEGADPPVRPAAPDRKERLGVALRQARDRKSTRLNSSHTVISYAVFCLKKKNTKWGASASDQHAAVDEARVAR